MRLEYVFMAFNLIFHFSAAFIRQIGELKRNAVNGEVMEFVHIAKTAGRSVKFNTCHKQGKNSPFLKCHKHPIRVADVQRRNHTAVVVLRDPIDRIQSAFVFVRSGGFGVNLGEGHPIGNYNSTDSLIAALSAGTLTAIESVRCEAKLNYCAPASTDKDPFDLMKHTTVEFRPQVWWLNSLPGWGEGSVRIICYTDLNKAFPTLFSGWSKKQRENSSLKGKTFLKREVQNPKNIAAITQKLYKDDYILYSEYCN